MHSRYIVFGVIALLVVGGGAWFIARSPASPFSAATATVSEKMEAPLLPPRQAPAGYTEYRNEEHRFAFFYPDGLSFKAYDEGGGAVTLVFQNPEAAEGFQIFVIPYREAKVSEEQFKRDAPSGVMLEPNNVSIDGAQGTMFFSMALALGETREVWFIHDGHLFEVTTMKPLDAWLGGIMNSWIWI